MHLVFIFRLTVPVLSVAKCWYLKVWTWCLQAITKKLHKQASVSGYFPTSTYNNKRQIGVMCRWWLLLCVFEKSLKYAHANGDVAQTLSNAGLDTETLVHSEELGMVAHTYLLRRQEIIGSPEPKFKATMGNIMRPPSQTKQSPTEETSCLSNNCCYIRVCVCVTCIFSGSSDIQLVYSYLGETQEELLSYTKSFHN